MGWRTAKAAEPKQDNISMMNGKEVHFLGVSKIIRGISDENGEVQGKTFHDLSAQSHRPWFLLDLETGQRGLNPGSEN